MGRVVAILLRTLTGWAPDPPTHGRGLPVVAASTGAGVPCEVADGTGYVLATTVGAPWTPPGRLAVLDDHGRLPDTPADRTGAANLHASSRKVVRAKYRIPPTCDANARLNASAERPHARHADLAG